MPTWRGLSGSATVSRTETAVVEGTVTVLATPTVYVEGTATVDRASLAAWAAQARRTATRVFLGEDGEDLIRITGDVSVSLDETSLIATASFQVVDPRCAFFHEDSIVTGGIPVSIKVRVAIDDDTTDTTVFRGATEAAPSDGTHVPRATVACAGEGAEWHAEKGCLYLKPFAGVTRLEALQAFAESVGIGPDRIRGGSEWGAVRLGLDLSGLSPAALAARFAAIEDSYLRLDGPDLEILPARDVVGPDAEPIFAFTPRNFFSCSETPPSRAPARLVLSSVGIPKEVLSGGTKVVTPTIEIRIDPDGTREQTTTVTTTVNGVVIRQRAETWRDAAIPGVTPSAVAWRLWRLSETEATWDTVVVDGVTLRTGRILTERTTVREWYSPPCRTTSGYVWSDGSRHLNSAAQWQVTADQITTYGYDDTCLLISKVIDEGGWYSPLATTGKEYPDGSTRADTAYQWVAPDDAQPLRRTTEANAEETTDALKAVSVSSRVYGYRVPLGSTATPPEEEWLEISGRDDRWETVPGSGLTMHAWTIYNEDGSRESKSEPASSAPVLVRSDAELPQYQTRPIVLEALSAAGASGEQAPPETIWGAESMDDLIRAARRRYRDAKAARFTIRHPALPLLRKCDVVTVTDPTWQLDARKGYVGSTRLTLNVSSTGKLLQETVVVFPPPEYDPEVPIVEAA